MTQISKTTFDALYVASGGTFLDNSTGQISEGDMRQFADDVVDSVAWWDEQYNPDISYFDSTDWILNVTNSALPTGFSPATSGAGAVMQNSSYGINSTEKCAGVIEMGTGTTTTGYSNIYKGTSFLAGVGHTLTISWRGAISALSDGTDTYTLFLGFCDNNIAESANGVYFKYTHSINGGESQAVTSAASVRTTTDTNVAPATTFQIFKIIINSAGTSCAFYIDGALVATNTTNIPTAAAQYIEPMFVIIKSAGTTARLLYQDWYYESVTRTTAR